MSTEQHKAINAATPLKLSWYMAREVPTSTGITAAGKVLGLLASKKASILFFESSI
jgi:hypothetical protein